MAQKRPDPYAVLTIQLIMLFIYSGLVCGGLALTVI